MTQFSTRMVFLMMPSDVLWYSVVAVHIWSLSTYRGAVLSLMMACDISCPSAPTCSISCARAASRYCRRCCVYLWEGYGTKIQSLVIFCSFSPIGVTRCFDHWKSTPHLYCFAATFLIDWQARVGIGSYPDSFAVTWLCIRNECVRLSVNVFFQYQLIWIVLD